MTNAVLSPVASAYQPRRRVFRSSRSSLARSAAVMLSIKCALRGCSGGERAGVVTARWRKGADESCPETERHGNGEGREMRVEVFARDVAQIDAVVAHMLADDGYK